MRCCFTYGKKRLYAAAVFFEDEDEDVGFLSSFEREREREQLGFLSLYHHKNIFFPTLKAPF